MKTIQLHNDLFIVDQIIFKNNQVNIKGYSKSDSSSPDQIFYGLDNDTLQTTFEITMQDFNAIKDFCKNRFPSKKRKVLQEKKEHIDACVYLIRKLFNLILTDSSLNNKEIFLQFKNEFDTEIDCLIKELLYFKSLLNDYEPTKRN